ncbi:MAG: YHS domain-containing protein [Syntrophobacteraceae bacterium]
MRRMKFVVLFAVTFGLLSLGWGMAGVATAAPQTKCPVMSLKVDDKTYVDYQGKRVRFCCPGCVDTFKKEPDKYMKKMEAEGVTLEKAPK